MSKKNDFITRAVLLALAMVLIALVLGSTIVAQREKSLSDSLYSWPAADAGYEAFLRSPEGNAPSLTLLIVDGVTETLYLVATREERIWAMILSSDLQLRQGEGLMTVEELRARGLPGLLDALTGTAGTGRQRRL